jgi:hypothetical protein
MREAPFNAHDIRAAAEVHAELGPDYGDAVVESFLAKLDKQIEARVDERLAAVPARRFRPLDPLRLSKWRYALAGAAVGAVVAGVPLTMIALRAMEFTGDGGRVRWVWVPLAIAVGLAAWRLRRRRG